MKFALFVSYVVVAAVWEVICQICKKKQTNIRNQYKLSLLRGTQVNAAVAARTIQAEFVRINTGTIEARDKLNVLLADALVEVADIAHKNHVTETSAVDDIINEVKVYVTDCIALGKTAIGSLQVERKARLDDLFNTHLYGNVEVS